MKVLKRYFLLILLFAIVSTLSFLSQYLTVTLGNSELLLPFKTRQPTGRQEAQFHLSPIDTRVRLLVDGDLSVPEIRSFLPHLGDKQHNKTSQNALLPSLKASQHRRNTTLVIGIPSIQRNATNYLMNTLDALLLGMSNEEKLKCLIIVLLSDTNAETVQLRHKELAAKFPAEIASGLIDVISPSPSFYPDFSRITPTLGDTPSRMKWRTKQTLDYAYLMMYAADRGKYFLQLEDDVLSANHFVTAICDFTAKQERENPDWIYIQYAKNGYIGKLFRNRDLMSFTMFYLMFHTAKPVDWLLRHYVTVKLCPYADPWVASRECYGHFLRAVVTHEPSLFQHVGISSSLDGKVQPLQEQRFLPGAVARPAVLNPRAMLKTTLKHYDKNNLHELYEGNGFFWAYPPVVGDYIQVELAPPIELQRFQVQSGLSIAPSDLLAAATFEVKPVAIPVSLTPNSTLPGFFVVASFDERGRVDGSIPASFGKISIVRVNIFKNHTNWLGISVFQLQP